VKTKITEVKIFDDTNRKDTAAKPRKRETEYENPNQAVLKNKAA